MLKAEAEWLLAQGIATRATAKDLSGLWTGRPNRQPGAIPQRMARHKLMDMLGDLALAQCQLVGRFTAYRSGHRLNAELVRALLTETELIGSRRRCA